MAQAREPIRGLAFDKKMLASLFEWVTERESIRKNKEAGKAKPWTDNEIMRNVRWCNVRRMDDRVSQWLLKNWYDKKAQPQVLLVGACLARLINWPDTLEYITNGKKFGADPAHMDMMGWVYRRLVAWESMGRKVFTGAYIINGARGGSKIKQVCENIDVIHKYNIRVGVIEPTSMETTHANLMGQPGIGSFMAGQIVADLRHTKAMKNPGDALTWAPIGPGSKRGMNRLLLCNLDHPLRQGEFEAYLKILIETFKQVVPDIWGGCKLEAMDVQNCLCEFDKYRRLTDGTGTTRSKYPGEAETAALGL